MRVSFVERSSGPERLVCDAEVIFDAGPLLGMKLVGFALWRSDDGLFVTFPSRAFGVAGERKYFDYLRGVDPGAGDHRRVKDWILEEYRTAKAA